MFWSKKETVNNEPKKKVKSSSVRSQKPKAVKRQSTVVVATKRKRARKTKTKTAESTKLGKVLSKFNLQVTESKNPIVRLAQKKDLETVNERMELAFKHIYSEFNQREQQLEQRIQEIQLQHTSLQQQKNKRTTSLILLGFLSAIAIGYMLFLLTNMQNSMMAMTGSVHNMDQHMTSMSSNTQTMTENMQFMSTNTYAMSQNMHNMNQSVNHMNHNVGQMSQSMKPIGEAAETTTPFIKVFRSFMPF